ncbi:MAG: hypothetical protein HFI69_06485 [Lachnospiraceae bacterium]|nr:hypothetical protein [Lachnospiraceae bacterium]
MTKFCKDKQILRINAIKEKLLMFKNWQQSADWNQAVELLTWIQQNAIIIGTVLEADVCDYHSVIKELEQLCELAYQMSISLDSREEIYALEKEAEKIVRDLQKQLRGVIPKKEVLFLPYQPSMWDSLESVWLEADRDPAADCYVVPLPFYDVLADGSLGTLHDKSGDYPEDVSVTSYQDYSVEERHPHVIFFHNPYDGCNKVTRVPEQFFSSRLKKCTERLVYIPYFVSEGNGPSDHQCYMPGVLFADQVIVQPGSVYEKYCRVYTRTLKENGWEGALKIAEEKFLPLGSPKFDKLLHTDCETGKLPERWRKVILKADGSRKKIILYNLTMNVLLVNDEQELIKVGKVFEVFKAMREEAVLLWRPHPLLLSTINSVRPQLRDAYLKLVQQFKEEGYGIFDETPDPNLAMALSDAYYGDWSSLLVTYRVTGKPVRVQDVWGEEEKEFLQEILEADNARTEDDSAPDDGQDGREQTGSRVYHAVMGGLLDGKDSGNRNSGF